MNDLASLFEALAHLALLIAPPIVLARLLAPGDDLGVGWPFAAPADLPWPRGVQEEEPRRWRLELLDRRRRMEPDRPAESGYGVSRRTVRGPVESRST